MKRRAWVVIGFVIVGAFTLIIGASIYYARHTDTHIATTQLSHPNAKNTAEMPDLQTALDAYPLQKDQKRLDTQAGALYIQFHSTRDGVPEEEIGNVLRLNEKIILHSVSIDLVAAAPHNSPRFVVISEDTGGSACCEYTKFIDVTTEPPFITEDIPISHTGIKFYSLNGDTFLLSGISSDQTDELGDKKMPVQFIYYPARRIMTAKSQPGIYDYSHFIGKYPSELFADETARLALIKLLGSHFKEFRQNMSRQAPMTLIDARYLVGSSDSAPYLEERGIFIVIDIYDGAVFAAADTDGKVQSFGKNFENTYLSDAQSEWQTHLADRSPNR